MKKNNLNSMTKEAVLQKVLEFSRFNPDDIEKLKIIIHSIENGEARTGKVGSTTTNYVGKDSQPYRSNIQWRNMTLDDEDIVFEVISLFEG